MDIPEDFDIEDFADNDPAGDLHAMLGSVRISEMAIITASNVNLF